MTPGARHGEPDRRVIQPPVATGGLYTVVTGSVRLSGLASTDNSDTFLIYQWT
jgi:hypothetical protein